MPASQPSAPPPWTDRAACAGHASADLDLWHPPPEDERHLFERARQVCAACPVLPDCREYGLMLLSVVGKDGVHGMFGGLTPKELLRLARRYSRPTRKMARHGTRSMYTTQSCRCRLCRAANARSEDARRKASAA